MVDETFVLEVGGSRRLPLSSVSLKAGAEMAVRSASADIAWIGAGLPCAEDETCTLSISGTLWLTGVVRDVNWAHEEESRTYSLSCVSRTVDATEASIDHPTGYIESCTIADVAKAFDTGGIGVRCLASGATKALHQIIPGESLFETLEMEARAIGAVIYDDPKGKLVIADKPQGRHAGGLIRGVNIFRASGTLSGRYNYSEVKVRGQSSLGTKGPALTPEAATAGTITRKRPLIIYHEGEVTSDRLKKRAGWEAKRAAGRGKSARITASGCRDAAGQIWTPHWLVSVEDDWGGLSQDMVISEVEITQDESGGTWTQLTVTDPRALGGENPRGDSAASWSIPGASSTTYRED